MREFGEDNPVLATATGRLATIEGMTSPLSSCPAITQSVWSIASRRQCHQALQFLLGFQE